MRLSTWLLASTLLLACATQEHDPEVKSAFEAFVAAIKARDAGRLYELSPPSLAEEMDGLQAELVALVGRVEREYPKSDRDGTLEALGPVAARSARTGRELFIALIDFDAVSVSAAVDRGLEIERIVVSGQEARVETRAGEIFQFVRVNDQWRCTTLLSQLEVYASLKRLRANMKVAATNLDRWEQATAENTNVRKPEGAFNVVVEAVRRGARVKVFEMLDEVSRKHLTSGLETIQKLQKALEKRYPNLAERTAYLQSHSATWVERVADEKSLFAGLWDAGKLESSLPFTGQVTLHKVDLVDEKKARVHFETGNGAETQHLVRTPDGLWRVAWLEPVLLREAVRAMEAELRAVPPIATPALQP